MDTEITNKDELLSLSTELTTQAENITTLAEQLKSSLSQAEDYEDFNVTQAANTLISNLDALTTDLSTVSTNINSYASQIIALDVNDFGSSSFENYLSSIGGTAITLPSGLGNTFTYMGWQCITAKSSMQYKLKEAAGMNFDEEGFGRVGDRYVVATTTTFGKVGDYIDVVQADGSVLKCIIGDIKNQNDSGCNQWGHYNGQNVIEFVVDKGSWYGKKDNPGTPSNHPEWRQTITQIVNKGNYFEMDAKPQATTANYVQYPNTSGSNTAATAATAVVTTTVANTMTYSGSGASGGTSYQTLTYNNPAPQQTPVVDSTPKQITETTPVTTTSGDPNVDISKYHNNLAAGFEVTTGNTSYELNDSDFQLICAIVSAESDKSYDDALAVVTTILNRCEAPNWVASHGTSPVSQATAPNQFVVYQHGSYKQYLGNAPETVVTAVRDALAGVRNHHYLSFRSNNSKSYSSNMITSTGNRYK